jgi:hypothetical protein
MSKFAGAFSNLGGNNQSDDYVQVDWDKVNKERADIFDTKEKAKSRVGIISGIIDLGVQPVEDGHKKSDIALEDEAAYIEEHPGNYFDDIVVDFKTKKVERHVFWPQKPQRAVAITVDFPQFQYDWGGDIGKKPFRFLLNGEYIHKGKKRSDIVVARTYDLKETTKDFHPRWSLAKNSLLYKAAVATNVIKPDEPFNKTQIGELIGKAALFEVRFYVNAEGYVEEKISFKGEVPEGMVVPEIDESILYYINLDGENEEAAVKQLRKSVKNTIKNSVSYPDSKLKEQFGDVIEGNYAAKQDNNVVEHDVDDSVVDDSDDVSGVDQDSFEDIPF